jgi:L-asparagine transporter-like permease
LLIYGVTALSYTRLIKVAEQNMLRFSSAYMQTTLIKFLVYMAFMLICLLTKSVENVESFVLSFFVLYLIFTIFEVKQVLSFYNNRKGKQQ